MLQNVNLISWVISMLLTCASWCQAEPSLKCWNNGLFRIAVNVAITWAGCVLLRHDWAMQLLRLLRENFRWRQGPECVALILACANSHSLAKGPSPTCCKVNAVRNLSYVLLEPLWWCVWRPTHMLIVGLFLTHESFDHATVLSVPQKPLL